MVYLLWTKNYTTWFKIKNPASPTTDTIDSITDHDRMVSLIDRLKYSLNIQKPPSLTCEKARLPAPIDNTIRLGFIVGLFKTMFDTIPAAVKPATVAEPRLTRIMAAISQPKTSGCKFEF